MARCPTLVRLLPLALLGACATPPAPVPRPSDAANGFDLQVVSPREGATVRNAVGLVEVSGRVGRDWLLGSDVAIALDLSNTAFLASGIDLDGDGEVGETHTFAEHGDKAAEPRRSWTSDPDDTIVLAELEAARHLIRGIDSPETRVGVITYTGKPRTRALMGPPREALASLDAIPLPEDWSGANIQLALRHAGRLFRAMPHIDGPDRPRVIFLLADGKPTAPQAKYWAARAAIEEAERLADRGIAVCVLGFGQAIVAPEEGDEDESAFLHELARTTGCEHVPIDRPDMLRFDRAPRGRAAAELTMRNTTTGTPARALRLLESGLFDGFVELVPGENRIEVIARLEDGRRFRAQRVVHYAQAEAETDDERRATARLLLRMRERRRQLDQQHWPEPAD